MLFTAMNSPRWNAEKVSSLVHRVEYQQGPLDGCVENDVSTLFLWPTRRFPAPSKDKYETHYIEYQLEWQEGKPLYIYVGEFEWSEVR